jgi:hypothetical protein
VRFFAWLLSKARIQSRSSLLHKRILTAAEAVCPVYGGEEETASHIIFGCEFAARFWRSLGFSFPHNVSVTMLHTYAAPAGIPAETASTFTLLAGLEASQRGCLSGAAPLYASADHEHKKKLTVKF